MIFLCMIILRTKTVAHTFFSMFQQCKWPSLSREILEINKFCYHGNLSRTSLLYTGMQLVEYLSPKMSCNDWM